MLGITRILMWWNRWKWEIARLVWLTAKIVQATALVHSAISGLILIMPPWVAKAQLQLPIHHHLIHKLTQTNQFQMLLRSKLSLARFHNLLSVPVKQLLILCLQLDQSSNLSSLSSSAQMIYSPTCIMREITEPLLIAFLIQFTQPKLKNGAPTINTLWTLW